MTILNLQTDEGGPAIVLRHGLASDQEVLAPLAKFLRDRAASAFIDNSSYNWRESVLRNGVDLASSLAKSYADRPVVLVGHSMGGLLCRVANLALNCNTDFISVMKSSGFTFGFREEDRDYAVSTAENLANKSKPTIKGIITLATPNSGALTRSQMGSYSNLTPLYQIGKALTNVNPIGALSAAASGASKLVSGTVRVGSEVLNFRYQSIQDLTSDRLFRLFQHFRTTTPCLSVSGSRGNLLTGAGLRGNIIKLGGINVAMPHDLIVEDRSVDLTQSVMSHEFDPTQYRHQRLYRDCIDADHFNIYNQHAVRLMILEFAAINLPLPRVGS